MSGGSYDYKYRQLEELANLLDPQNRDDFQSIRQAVANALRELSEICHDIEWIDSGDYGNEDWDKIKKWIEKHNFNPQKNK